MKHNIEMVRPFYTGGNIYCYFGKADGYWFDVSDAFEEVCILDTSPFDENGEVTQSAWDRELEDEHLVEYLEDKDADEFKIQMYRWIIEHQHEKDVMDGIFSIEPIKFDLNELLSK